MVVRSPSEWMLAPLSRLFRIPLAPGRWHQKGDMWGHRRRDPPTSRRLERPEDRRLGDLVLTTDDLPRADDQLRR